MHIYMSLFVSFHVQHAAWVSLTAAKSCLMKDDESILSNCASLRIVEKQNDKP